MPLILLINLLFGWTLFGWLGPLLLAIMSLEARQKAEPKNPRLPDESPASTDPPVPEPLITQEPARRIKVEQEPKPKKVKPATKPSRFGTLLADTAYLVTGLDLQR